MATVTDASGHVPGTVRIQDLQSSGGQLVLQPTPTSDPNDPLNWSKSRKLLNYGLICFYVLWTFVNVDIGFTSWAPLIDEFGISDDTLNASAALSYGGLAVGCIFFVPLVHKYGRRPIYLCSVVIQLVSCIWQAEITGGGTLIAANLIGGLGGAISEVLVQMTIADIFFVHQHATMNSWYLVFTGIGAFLGPVASGYVVDSQGWRWTWWWCVIFLSITLVAVIFLFEETKYIPATVGQPLSTMRPPTQTSELVSTEQALPKHDSTGVAEHGTVHRSESHIQSSIPLKTYRQRMALITPSPGPVIQHFYQPLIVLFTYPAVAYTAFTYGLTLTTFAIMTSIQATYMVFCLLTMVLPPYNFSADGIGLMNVPPFIGLILGFVVGGWFNDRSALYFAKRNNGIFEPEMRLWLALPAAAFIPIGILVFGIGLAHGTHWIVLAVGYGIWGVGFILAGTISLAYVTDCYQDIIGDALVGVIFCRNVVSVVVLFLLTPWLNAMGIQNLHILTACVMVVVLLAPLLLLKWGKAARIRTASSYRKMALKQGTSRTF